MILFKGIHLQQLKALIEKSTVNNTQEVLDSITEMICTEDDPIDLCEETLTQALQTKGEFLLLKLHFDDYNKELAEEKIKYKISQSLNVIISYEDDGNSYDHIEKFAKYIYKYSDEKQNVRFGIKKVHALSKFPVKILFSGILPINQLKMTFGKGIFKLIDSDRDYFRPRFKQLRDDISQEIGIPILPLFPIVDESLQEYQVVLHDLKDGRVISDFHIPITQEKDLLEIYLLKLFYVYITLAKK